MIKDLNYYMKLNYKIEIIEDKKEGGFALHCPELPGCITSAETLEQGYMLIQDAKQCWFTACLEDGIEIPEPLNLDDYSGQLRLRMPRSLHRNLSERSKREGISMNQLCIYLLSGGVGSA
jgi:predicted RNase H-like HicB family nuclease